MEGKVKVFVSYAQDDFKARAPRSDTRISWFFSEVRSAVEGGNAERSSIVFLRDVDGMIRIGDSISKKIDVSIDECEIFLVILSNNYARSPSCRDEFEKIREIIKKAAGAGRYLIVADMEEIQDPAALDDWRDNLDFLKDIKRARFWMHRNGQRATYGVPLPPDDKKYQDDFYTEAGGVTQAIFDYAKASYKAEKKKWGVHRGPADIKVGPGEAAIYLAWPTGDMMRRYEEVRSRLEEKQIKILQPRLFEEFGSLAEIKSEIERNLKKAKVYVQMFGLQPGKTYFGSEHGFAELQYRMAEHLEKKGELEIFLWRRNDFDIEDCDSAYKEFLERRSFQDTSLPDFANYVAKHVARSEAEHGKNGYAGLIGVDADKTDLDLMKEIMDALAKRSAQVFSLPFETKSDRDSEMTELKGAVLRSDAIVLVHGKSAAGQSRASGRFPLVSRFAVRKKPPLAIGIADGSAPDGLPCPRGPRVFILYQNGNVNETQLQQFLKTIPAA